MIVPTSADRTPRLQSALASIWAQEGLGERFDVEPIVVDDASPGSAEQVVRRFPGTRYVRHSTNRGQAAARNSGLAEATGEYVAFLDDDDLWLPRRLSGQVAVMEQAQQVEVAYSQQVFYRRGTTPGVTPGPDAPSGWVYETALKSAICHIQTILVPRAALEKVRGFDERLSVMEDHDFLTRLALFFPFRFVPGVVAIYLPSEAERSQEGFRRDLLTRRDSVLGLIEGLPNASEISQLVLSTTSWHMAHRFYRGGDLGEAREEFLRWVAAFPPLEGDEWVRSRMKEMILLLALASTSPIAEATSLCAEVRRTARRGEPRQQLEMRSLLSDVWAALAVRLGSGRLRGTGRAGSAAFRAILQNPLKPLSRPGLLRLMGRTVLHPSRLLPAARNS